MKLLAGILLSAGCLLGAPQAHAQAHPAESAQERPAQGLPAEPAQGHQAVSASEFPGVPATELPAEFAARAHAAAGSLRMLPPEEFGLQWLREEVNPFLRERRRLHRAMRAQAEAQESVLRKSRGSRDPNKEVGTWRMSIGNTSVNNWSPFQDRALDARTIRFPVPRDARADKRTDQTKALDRMRQQRR